MELNTFTHRLTKIVVDTLLVIGTVGIVTIPLWGSFAQDYALIGRGIYLVLYLSGICAIFILWQIRQFFKSFKVGNPFELANVVRLRKCSLSSFAIAIIYAVKVILVYTNASAIIALFFAILGLFCLTIKDLFKQAIKYKEDNDLTI